MPTRIWITAIVLTICACAAPAVAQTAKASAITFGVRQYTSHSDDSGSPFGEGDVSYLAAYEYHEAKVYWQFGVSYTPHASSTSTAFKVDSVITPQIRLIFEEGMLLLGVGALKHYMQQADANSWSDLYWELEAGLHHSVSSSVDIRGVAYYTFKDWGDIGKVDTSQLELGLELAYRF